MYSWDGIKRLGYGLLGLTPDALFSLTATEYTDMLNAKLRFIAVEHDRELEKVAWQTSLLMSATGNYGKRGVDPKKLYQRQFDDLGNLVTKEGSPKGFKSIDKKEKNKKLSALFEKFNRTGKSDSRGG